jgi:hypothetical protein
MILHCIIWVTVSFLFITLHWLVTDTSCSSWSSGRHCRPVKYRFPIGIRWKSEIRLRNEVRISKVKRPRYRGNIGVRTEYRTRILEGKGLGFSSCAAPFSTPSARFRRETRRRTEVREEEYRAELSRYSNWSSTTDMARIYRRVNISGDIM